MKKIPIFKTVKLIAAFSLVLFLAGCGGGGGGGSEIKPEGVIIHVQPSPSLPSDGKSWASAYKNLQDVLSVAESGSEIWVAAGTYTPGIDRASSFTMKEGVAIYGGFIGTETSREQRDWVNNATILSGDIGTPGDNSDNSYHVVKGANNATLDGFIISDGNANTTDADYPNNCGGGMLNIESSPSVANCTFTNNSAGPSIGGTGWGGGMNNHSSNPTITNCIFANNSAKVGGGGISNYKSSLTVNNCTFSGNSSFHGGGMYSDTCTLTVTNSTFSSNTADVSGGMENLECNVFINNCSFSGNTADYGGGMSNGKSSLNIINCTFSGNSSNSEGGGIANYYSSPAIINCLFSSNRGGGGGGILNGSSSPIIINCTFANNSANNGGGIYNSNGSSVQVLNSILWSNTATTSGNQIYNSSTDYAVDAPSTTTIAYSCVQDGTTDNHNFTANPLLNSDLTLSSGSPCINAGDSGALPDGITTDLTGNPRIIGSSVDMGAYECQQ